MAIADQDSGDDRQRQEEMQHVRQHADDGQHFGRKQDLLDQVAAGDERTGRFGQRRREPGPREDAAQHEERVRLKALRAIRHDRREDEGVDREEQQRVDERPEEPEHGSAVTRFELARDEARNEPAIADQLQQVTKHYGMLSHFLSAILQS